MSFIAVGAVGAGIGVLGNAYGIIKGIGQQNAANKIHPYYTPYVASPYATQQLSLAQQLYNGRMPGAAEEEQNINNAQANATAAAERGSTNSGQLLSTATLGQTQANKAYSGLGIQEEQNKYNLLSNLNNAYATNINEAHEVNDSMWNKYQSDVDRQAKLAGAGAQSVQNGINGIGSVITGIAGLL